jgi:hypothetical protein
MELQEMDDNPGEDQSQPHFWTVAIYLVDRAYGGPEEGGWWYYCGQRVDEKLDVPELFDLPCICNDGDGAIAIARAANEILDRTLNTERRSDINSVLSEGRYTAEVYAGYPPAWYPEVKPHYE